MLETLQRQLNFFLKVWKTRDQLSKEDHHELVGKISDTLYEIEQQIWKEAGMLD